MDIYYVATDFETGESIACASNMTDMMEWLLTLFEDSVYDDFCYNYYKHGYSFEEAYKLAWDYNLDFFIYGIEIEAVEFVG